MREEEEFIDERFVKGDPDPWTPVYVAILAAVCFVIWLARSPC